MKDYAYSALCVMVLIEIADHARPLHLEPSEHAATVLVMAAVLAIMVRFIAWIDGARRVSQ